MLSPSAAVAQAGSIGAAVVLAMISGVMFVGDLPAWVDRIAGVLPLRPLNEAVGDQFNPFLAGSGWDLGALAILAAWGIAGALVAARAFRWDPPAHRSRTHPARDDAPAPAPAPHSDPLPVTAASRPGAARLALAQAAWATKAAWRDPGTVFFAVALPVGLYVLIAQSAGGDVVADGVPFVLFTAAGMITWGAAVAGFVNAAETVARARDRGVLKRLRGTPLHPALYLAGQVLAALWIGLLVATVVLAVGLGFLGLQISWAGLLPAAAVLLLGAAAVTACGLALAAVVPSSKAMVAVGLGILLPVSFFSDVFYTGGSAPAWMDTIGSVLPLRHLVHGLTAALDPAGTAVDWTGIGVLGAWLVGAGLLAWRGFSWTVSGHRPPQGADERRGRAAAGSEHRS
jgi:ABC-type multidrug transport system permease subunit